MFCCILDSQLHCVLDGIPFQSQVLDSHGNQYCNEFLGG